uniref:Uncharacterized protein n=1 Tax=Alsidium seaforthii TaxID=2007182 RepID=A0A1Z1MD45_9FLOR|nr:hypothetical protein [Bryothamnion seaforthii]ARW63886.1 hypothetical protein [Bryothamnion seaforthii]
MNKEAQKPFYICVNRDQAIFIKKLNPPTDGQTEETLSLVSSTDKKMIGTMHHLLVTTIPNRRYRIKDTVHIMHLIDNAILICSGQISKYTLPSSKWQEIKSQMEEQIITKEVQIPVSKTSLTPVQTQQDYQSDSE